LLSIAIRSILIASADVRRRSDRQIALRMKHDFECQRTLLETRVDQLPRILSCDHYMVIEWPV